jgi:folylpolyglutamate synthase/dihydropteroate synthase
LGKKGRGVEIVDEFEKAIEKGLSLTRNDDLFCITGSLYTVGEARAYFRPRERS